MKDRLIEKEESLLRVRQRINKSDNREQEKRWADHNDMQVERATLERVAITDDVQKKKRKFANFPIVFSVPLGALRRFYCCF